MVAEGPDGPVTFAFRVVGVEEFEVESSQHFLVVQRTARLAGSIRREAAYEAPVFWRAQQLRPRWRSRPRFERAAFGCGIESRKAHALAERRGSRGARVCEMRQKTKDDRRLSAVRLNFCRRNRHRRHLDEQRERARRRPAVAGRAEPGLNRPRRRSRPGGPHGGRPADKEASSPSCLGSCGHPTVRKEEREETAGTYKRPFALISSQPPLFASHAAPGALMHQSSSVPAILPAEAFT